MGFYLRKSIRVGPLRFNLSTSGIGVSAGVKGFRVGTGPRGNYVHLGRGGIYYRRTLSPSRTPQSQVQGADEPPLSPDSTQQQGVGQRVEIESGDVTAMVDSSSAELLRELDEKKRKTRLGPVVSTLAVLCAFGLLAVGIDPVIQIAIAICWIAAIYFAFRRDTLTKTVVLFYSFEPPLEHAYGALHEAAAKLASCAGCWHIAASARVYDRKYHAGASALFDRKRTPIRTASPKFLKTNIETLSIGVGKQTMFLFPDRILVYQSGKVGAIGYDQLEISVSQKKFIEDSAAPHDARVVGQTWRYVNKDGGPDRRFSNNRRLPVCLYDELHFSSATGLNEIIQVSRCGIAENLREAVSALNSQLHQATAPQTAAEPMEASYRIGRNGEDLGDLPLSAIKQLLSHGGLSLQDYYFDFGMNTWATLDRIAELQQA